MSFKELFLTAITKPPEVIVNVSVSVSFFVFPCSKGHFVRAYLDTIKITLTLSTIWLFRNFSEVLGGVVYGTWRLENAFKDSKEAASNPLSNIWKSLYLLTLWLHNYNRNCHIINSYCRLGFWATPPFNMKGKVTLEIYDQAYLLQGITEAQRLNSKLDFVQSWIPYFRE